MIAASLCGRGHRRDVRSHSRFGERAAADLDSFRERDEEFPFLFLRPPLEEGERAKPGVDRHRHTQGGVHRFEFFADQAEGDEVHACAAVADRDRDAEEPEAAHAFEREGDGLLLAVIFFDDGRDLFLGEVPHHLFCHFMFGGEGKIHEAAPSAFCVLYRESNQPTVR